MSTDLRELVTTRSIVLCCGTGGVGKTTSAAALAIEAARAGRRVCVVTIDPAKRLADALGLVSLTNEPSLVHGDWPGALYALMLDTKRTFDALVTRYAPDPEQARRILDNRFYRNISSALSGTQEYMAAEKLYELHEESGFDLVVVDTPPTRNALDFVEAPKRLTHFLDHRLYRILMMPTRLYMKAVNVAAQAFLRTVSRVVGGEVVADAIAFFQAFEGMEAGFKDRARRVHQLLTAPETVWVLVAAPRADAIAEASYFARRLYEMQITVSALVVNRMHPRFGDTEVPDRLAGTPLEPFAVNLAQFRAVAAREDDLIAPLVAQVAPAPTVRVPFLPTDVHDLDGLITLGGFLLAQPDRHVDA
jgi:anion-transporting  ArsA/GET3 family ATPase